MDEERFLVRWIHPSYRDLVIDQVSEDMALRKLLLSNMGLNGMKLALSDVGGAAGARRWPLLETPEDWTLIRARCEELIQSLSLPEVIVILEIITDAWVSGKSDLEREDVTGLLSVAYEAARKRSIEEDWEFTAHDLKVLSGASILVFPLPPFVKLYSTWKGASTDIAEALIYLDEWFYVESGLGRWEHFVDIWNKLPERSRAFLIRLMRYKTCRLLLKS